MSADTAPAHFWSNSIDPDLSNMMYMVSGACSGVMTASAQALLMPPVPEPLGPIPPPDVPLPLVAVSLAPSSAHAARPHAATTSAIDSAAALRWMKRMAPSLNLRGAAEDDLHRAALVRL